MIPPRGFKAELYPLRHRLIYRTGIGLSDETINTVYFPIIMGTSDMDREPEAVIVNPHNAAYMKDAGAVCRQMSIIDRLRISLKFQMTSECGPKHETAAGVFFGDDVPSFHFVWRPIFGSFKEKLDAADDDTTLTTAAILGLTVDATNEDVVPITTTKLAVTGGSETLMPVSTVNTTQDITDFNMTSTLGMEEHVFDEDILHDMLERGTNKGALRSLLGRTRHVTLTRNKPFQNVFIDKFLPRAVRRIVPFSFLGIQVHLPIISDADQHFFAGTPALFQHLGISCIANYHEWSHEHDQDMESQV